MASPIYFGGFGRTLQATCGAGKTDHSPPAAGCECGVYAVTSLASYEAFKEWVPGLHRNRARLAFCKVLLWDAIQSTSRGDIHGTLRGSRATITRVWVESPDSAARLSALLADVELVPDLDAVIRRELCDHHVSTSPR